MNQNLVKDHVIKRVKNKKINKIQKPWMICNRNDYVVSTCYGKGCINNSDIK